MPEPQDTRHGHLTAIWLTLATMVMISMPTWASDDPLDDALNQAPQDATFLIIAPSMTRLSEKTAMVNRQLDLNIPDLLDVLGEFKRTAGLIAGIDDQGPLVIAVRMNSSKPDQPDDRSLLLLPVSDYTAFIQPLTTQEDDPIRRITLTTGHEGFAKQSGSFAVIGKHRESLASHQPANNAAEVRNSLGTLGNQVIEDSDVIILMHGEQIQHTLDSANDMTASNADDRTTNSGQKNQATISGMKGALIQQALDPLANLDSLTPDAEGVVLGFTITNEGLNISGAINFKADSATVSMINPVASSNDLTRVPDQPFLIASSVNFGGLELSKLRKLMLGKIHPMTGDNWLSRAIMAHSDEAGNMQTWVQVKYLPSQTAAVGGMTSTLNCFRTSDARGLAAHIRKELETLNSHNQPDSPDRLGAAGVQDSQTPATVHYQINHFQIDGQSVDQYSVSQLPQSQNRIKPPGPMGPMGPMLAGLIQGSEEKNGFIVASGQYVLVTESPDMPLLRRSLKALEAETGLGANAQITAGRKQLLGEAPIAESYIDIGSILQLPMMRMGLAMFGIKPQLQAQMIPITVGLSVRDHGIGGRFHVPTSVIDMGTTVIMQAQGIEKAPSRPARTRPKYFRKPGAQPHGRDRGLPFAPGQGLPPDMPPGGFRR